MSMLRARLGTAFVAATACLPGVPALACSDLPNICAAHAQVQAENLDNAYVASMMYAEQQASAHEDEAHADDAGPGWDYETFMGTPFAADPSARELARIREVVEAFRQSLAADDAAPAATPAATPAGTRAASEDDAALARRHAEGGWSHFQDVPDAAPGEYCAALYWKGDGLVRISGPGGDYAGAMLTFWGPDVPRPAEVRRVPVVLRQTDERPQQVQAFHYALPGEAFAAVALAVPTLEAALAGMLDRHRFEVELDGRTVATVEWDQGFAARDQLRGCAAQRAAAGQASAR
jgi:hypothetical protein